MPKQLVRNAATAIVCLLITTSVGLAQQRSYPLGIDRKFQPGEGLFRWAIDLAGLQVEQALGIYGDGVRFDRRGRGHGAGNNLALHQKTLNAGVNQAGAELRKIEDADHQHEETGKVEGYDAAGKARKSVPADELAQAREAPGRARPRCRCRAPFGWESGVRLGRGRGQWRGSVEHGDAH